MAPNKENKIEGWNSPVLIHPGEHLLDFIEDAGISQAELATRIGISKKAVNEIVKGKAPITQNTAFRLSKVFATSPDFWVNLQNNYDLALAHLDEEKRVQIETEKYLPKFHETFKELCRIGVFKTERWTKQNFSEITKQLQQFFAVDSLAYVQNGTMDFAFQDFAFRKYDRQNLNRYTLAAWVQLGKIKAQKTEIPPFDRDALKALLPEIKLLSRKKWEEYIPELEKLLASCGVVLVYAPKMTCAPAQGATHWIDGDRVLIMLNTDNQFEGKFWFNLFHEIGHVLLHGKKDVYVDFGKDGTKTEAESEADSFAQKWLIPDIDAFYKRLGKYEKLETAIQDFAKENDVSPAIVAGRLTHEYKDADRRIYSLMNPFQTERITYSNISINK